MALYQKDPYGVNWKDYPLIVSVKEALGGMENPITKKETRRDYRKKLHWKMVRNRCSPHGAYYKLTPAGFPDELAETYFNGPHSLHASGYNERCFLRVVNGTPESKGSHKGMSKVFFLRVPILAAHGTVESAISWTYGMPYAIPRYSGQPDFRPMPRT